MILTRWFASKAGRIVRFALLLAFCATPMLSTQAQDDDRPGAPGNLSVESRDTGILLSWEAPVGQDPDYFEITNYEISGSHVRRGTGIVEEVSGSTSGQDRSWLDRQAVDPGLLYVYRVRALFDGVPGRWSGFVITGYESSGSPAPPPAPEPTAPPPPSEPTATPADPFAQFTAQAVTVVATTFEPTAAGPEPEPTQAAPAAPLQPTAPPPPSEPTSPPPPPEPTVEPPVAPVEPTAEAPPPEPTVAPPVAPVEPTAEAPPPEPTVAPPGSPG